MLFCVFWYVRSPDRKFFKCHTKAPGWGSSLVWREHAVLTIEISFFFIWEPQNKGHWIPLQSFSLLHFAPSCGHCHSSSVRVSMSERMLVFIHVWFRGGSSSFSFSSSSSSSLLLLAQFFSQFFQIFIGKLLSMAIQQLCLFSAVTSSVSPLALANQSLQQCSPLAQIV